MNSTVSANSPQHVPSRHGAVLVPAVLIRASSADIRGLYGRQTRMKDAAANRRRTGLSCRSRATDDTVLRRTTSFIATARAAKEMLTTCRMAEAQPLSGDVRLRGSPQFAKQTDFSSS